MNKWRKYLYEKNNMENFKYKNLNVLQPFASKTLIYSCRNEIDVRHIKKLDKKDTNLIINYISKNKTHFITKEMTKEEFINLIINQIED